jgi:uncharacterized protein YlxW (UPF0749 family)
VTEPADPADPASAHTDPASAHTDPASGQAGAASDAPAGTEPAPEAAAAPAPGPASDAPGDPGAVEAPPAPPAGAWHVLARALAPRATRGQLLAGLLCALLGFAIVVQVQQNRSEGLAGLSQDELVRILDEVTERTDDLEQEAAALRSQRAELVTGTDTERAAREAAQERATVQGILAGTLAAQGPGVELVIREPDERLDALLLVNVLEELRNAGAEAIQLGDVRITASSYIVDTAEGVEVDGTRMTAPYRWVAIGDPDTIIPALQMPGGAFASIRAASGTAAAQALDEAVVSAVREAAVPEHATPVPSTAP